MEDRSHTGTLLVALAHPDDEMLCAGTIAAHRAAGHDVLILWLTRGEQTDSFGRIPLEAVAQRRVRQGRKAAELLGCRHRFLDLADTRLVPTPGQARRVAMVLAEVRPTAVITWGDAWARGLRHPDHEATGKIVRDAVTLARMRRVVAPTPPHREPVPVFTIRGAHSRLPEVGIDVTPHLGVIEALARFQRGLVGWPPHDWLMERLRRAGSRFGVELAEAFDAWETSPGLQPSLLD